MIDNDKNILSIDIFVKLLRIIQNSNSFKLYKTPFLYSFYFFIYIISK